MRTFSAASERAVTNRLATASACRTSWATRNPCVFHLYCRPRALQDVELERTACMPYPTSVSATPDSLEIHTQAAHKTSHAALPLPAGVTLTVTKRVTEWNAAAQQDYKEIPSHDVMTSMNAWVLAVSAALTLAASTLSEASNASAQME